MNNQTIELAIPVELKEDIKKIVARTEKCVSGISLEFGKNYMKPYIHTYVRFDDEGRPHGVTDVQMHEVCDMVLTTPSSDWKLKCSYEDDVTIVADLKQELIIKNPEHGAKYKICDCCKHRVYKYSYLIENAVTGEELQVGKECLKKYNLESISIIYRQVYDALGLTHYEYRDLGFGSGEDVYITEWRYRDVNTGKRSMLIKEMIRAAKAFYDVKNGEWKSAYVDDFGRYQKSESNAALQNFSCDSKNYDHIAEGYVSEVFSFLDNVIAPKIENAYIGDYEFERDMLDTLIGKVYMPLCVCHYAFFAVKKYEQHLERERQRLEMERLGKLQVGQLLHVKGQIISHNQYEGYFGKYDVYEVRSERGYTLRRKGVLPVADDKKTTEFYAQVLGISSNGVVSLDRATKRPKKNVQYLAV